MAEEARPDPSESEIASSVREAAEGGFEAVALGQLSRDTYLDDVRGRLL